MKNFYEILGVPENATTSEIVQKGRRLIQEYAVEHRFAGKRMNIDYTMEEWREANNIYAQIIEAYQVLKDERKRTEYNNKLLEQRRRQSQQTSQQTTQRRTYGQTEPFHANTREQDGYRSQDAQSSQTRQRRYRSERYQTSNEGYGFGQRQSTQGSYSTGQRTTYGSYGPTGQRTRQSTYTTAGQRGYSTQNAQGTQRTQRYSRTHTDSTMERSQKRGKKAKGAFSKMIDSFKEVKQDEREYPLYERHQDLNGRIRNELHKNIKSVPGEIVYQMANGTLHVTYEFIHQLKKLKYINEDSLPKYVFRNRKLAAAALAVALMASAPGGEGNETIIIEQPPAVTITQETQVEDPIEEEYEVVYEEPTVQMTEYYEVVKGDTISRISTRTGVKVYQIQEDNNRVGSDKIYIGETLVLNRTIDREDLQYYTITVPAKGMTCAELARMYRTDEETIRMLNKEAIAYINTGYTILTDTAVVPNFITVEEKDVIKEMMSGRHN